MTDNRAVGAVVIGRNEGDRLKASLASVRAAGIPLVYVDSGSLDRSVEIAKEMADAVVELDPARPFTAARARNEGLRRLQSSWPAVDYVLFLDGDCRLEPQFVPAAVEAMLADPRRAIVTGHLREHASDISKFHRLCALEWQSPAGEIVDYSRLGGIMLARVKDVVNVGGFNEHLIAGEDPELGVRLGLAGRRATKIDVPMAVHRADITHFSQWWRRAVRGGHAMAHRYAINGRSKVRDCAREFYSTLFWGIALPVIILGAAWPTRGLSLLLAAGYLVLAARIYRHFSRRGASVKDARLGARYGIYIKFANAVGLLRFLVNARRGKFEIIEYK